MDWPKYVIVIPAKNEEENLAATLDSVAAQTIKPEACLVVDDGSDDDTYTIAKMYREKYAFIHCIQREGEKEYALGGHVVDVFEHGRAHLESNAINYEYIVKLDADLCFDSEIVKNIFTKITKGNWAIISGTPYLLENGKKIFENSPSWHSHGQFKFYNHAFLAQIGSIPRSLGWDTADNILALSKGWKTAAFKDIHYKMSRRVGGKYSLVKGRVKHGTGCYVLGYSPLYFALAVSHDMFRPPVILGAVSKIKGYLTAMLQGRTQILNKPQKILLRKLLWGSLWGRLKNQEFEVLQKVKKNQVSKKNAKETKY